MEERWMSPVDREGERPHENTLRPSRFEEYVGQSQLSESPNYGGGFRGRGGYGPCFAQWSSGSWKDHFGPYHCRGTGVDIHVTSGPAIERKGDLAGILSNLGEHDVLFIDEIHRMNAVVEETYPAMEDFQFDIVIEGPHTRSMKLPLKPFTLVGATTRTGLLTSPFETDSGFTRAFLLHCG